MSSDLQQALERLAKPFLSQGAPVYLARCCGRLYAGAIPPTLCRSCRSSPRYLVVSRPEDVRVDALPDNQQAIT